MPNLSFNYYPDPIVCIPSTFVIGRTGVPLEVVGGYMAVNDFLQHLEKAFKVCNKTKLAFVIYVMYTRVHKKFLIIYRISLKHGICYLMQPQHFKGCERLKNLFL